MEDINYYFYIKLLFNFSKGSDYPFRYTDVRGNNNTNEIYVTFATPLISLKYHYQPLDTYQNNISILVTCIKNKHPEYYSQVITSYVVNSIGDPVYLSTNNNYPGVNISKEINNNFPSYRENEKTVSFAMEFVNSKDTITLTKIKPDQFVINTTSIHNLTITYDSKERKFKYGEYPIYPAGIEFPFEYGWVYFKGDTAVNIISDKIKLIFQDIHNIIDTTIVTINDRAYQVKTLWGNKINLSSTPTPLYVTAWCDNLPSSILLYSKANIMFCS